MTTEEAAGSDEKQMQAVEIPHVWRVAAVECLGQVSMRNSFEGLEVKNEDYEVPEGDDEPRKLLSRESGVKNRWNRKRKEEFEEEVRIQPVTQGEVNMDLMFQVADVKRPLASVRRIVENGNHVHFGPKDEDNFIMDRETGDKVKLRPNGRGSYMLDVSFEGGRRGEITIDSGAEDSVCPWEWGKEFGLTQKGSPMMFRNASGGKIEHFGQRMVTVQAPF